MNDYQFYTLEEFTADEVFREWVLDPTGRHASFWENWLAQHPEKTDTVNQAKILVLTIHQRYIHVIDEAEIDNEIASLVMAAEERSRRAWTGPGVWLRNPMFRVAASLLLLSGIGWYYYTDQTPVSVAKSQHALTLPEEQMVVKCNTDSTDLTIFLSDNSVATLKMGSTITYPRKFTGDTRVVNLSGEAFFDITRNPAKPFLVFANGTVTKVLGTSFRVKAFAKDNTVMVLVKTGKVSVYPQKEYETLVNDQHHEVAGVILNPNQQAVFKRKENRLEKGIVSDPQLLTELPESPEIVFDDKPVADVLHALEKAYGIVILFDRDILASCAVSTQFREESLKQRMNAICQAIGATYEVIDGQIIVNSKGCS
ncbi:hypothetical protein DYBT9275_01869 [Dyadobacter sp. CECT 9275]|uniref:FecR family protein n=1 Tax=Dyadobacter helix TaxID=2822344 RepID=A0A916JAU3_9BACT|nr:FecR domain-containing protein [Dyadobacter sp. CECT 9275]CAG4997869.1 hypothetical protein DYBT9275_01869 [Dyadobacter sp. CECT 9275]